MVYIFECVYSDRNKEKLESLRKSITRQIIEGVVLLPSEVRLKEVVKTEVGLDVVVNAETKKSGKLNIIDGATKNDSYIDPQIENFVNKFGWG